MDFIYITGHFSSGKNEWREVYDTVA